MFDNLRIRKKIYTFADKIPYMDNTLTSSFAIHPGEMIKDEIEARGLSQRQLAEQMEVSPSVLNEVLNGKRPVSTEYALMLEAVLGIEAGIWLRLQMDYNMQVTKSNNTFLAKLEKLRKVAAVL